MKILFAYDGSEGSNAAITAAGELLNREGVDAIVLSVWEPLLVEVERYGALTGPFAGASIPMDAARVDEAAQDQAQQLAEHGAELAREAGFEARAVSVAESRRVYQTILDEADQLGANLIVLGARGLAGIAAYMGSVSNHVLQHAQRPVLVIPTTLPGHNDPGKGEVPAGQSS